MIYENEGWQTLIMKSFPATLPSEHLPHLIESPHGIPGTEFTGRTESAPVPIAITCEVAGETVVFGW
jgi:hypothetical protein